MPPEKGHDEMAKKTDELLAQEFCCARCGHKGAHVERLAMTGTGISAWLEVQKYRYAFVSCTDCGYTEEGKDDLRTFLEILFAD
jgi:predicted nucleic-acid-binding Zn-ribbon protein